MKDLDIEWGMDRVCSSCDFALISSRTNPTALEDCSPEARLPARQNVIVAANRKLN
jgi:hypothetical protein